MLASSLILAGRYMEASNLLKRKHFDEHIEEGQGNYLQVFLQHLWSEIYCAEGRYALYATYNIVAKLFEAHDQTFIRFPDALEAVQTALEQLSICVEQNPRVNLFLRRRMALLYQVVACFII